MNLYYISRNYKSSNNAASKPKTDCEVVMAKNGFKNLGFKQTTHASSALGAIISLFGITKGLLLLPSKSVLAMQYPLSKFYGYVTNVARGKGCKIILIVHDVKSLMGKSENIEKEMRKFSKADILIVHNDQMKEWFIENGYHGKIIPLYLFDYMSFDSSIETGLVKNNEQYEIVFAGGLGKEKSAFIYKMDNFKKRNFTLKLYGNGFQKNEVNANSSIINYQGVFSPDAVVKEIKGNFGLVWNGNSVSECAGDFGKYLLYNNPHKTSLYILCGLPILVWEKAAIAKFITSNKLGIAINTLEEVDEKLKNLSKEEYEEMTTNVALTREKIMEGGFLSEALKNALQVI